MTGTKTSSLTVFRGLSVQLGAIFTHFSAAIMVQSEHVTLLLDGKGFQSKCELLNNPNFRIKLSHRVLLNLNFQMPRQHILIL